MSNLLPVQRAAGNLLVVDPDTGEAVELRNATDRTLAAAADRVTELDKQVLEAKRALALELRDRHGVGTCHAGGYRFIVNESQSWPSAATKAALDELVDTAAITEADAKRAMPLKPKPDATQLKALAGRLAVSNPDAARVLAQACTVSPPSVRDIQVEVVDGEVAT